MVYKKYIKKNGKLYGPYIYHSRRVNGKVISEYHGASKKIDYKKFIFIFLGVLFLSGVTYGIVSNKAKLTGHVTDLGANYQEAQEVPVITNLTITQLHETDELPHKYELDLEVLSPENSTLDYFWEIDCGYIYLNENASSDYTNVVEWYTTGECIDAVVNVSVTDENGNGQKLIQPVFNSENRVILDIGLVSESENETGTDITEENVGGEENFSDNEIEIQDYEKGKEPEKIEISEQNISETPETIKTIVKAVLPLSDEERQILINAFGTDIIKTEVKLFKDRIIVRYEFGNLWIKNSYDSDLDKNELEEQMYADRIRWLRDIINKISEEGTEEQELEGFEDSYSV